jgi:MFS family permease
MAILPAPPDRPPRSVLAASMLGSVVEWYDLFVYGTLVYFLSRLFFPSVLGIPSLILSLLAFVAGAAVRPLGGAVFGRAGDLLGRRYAFVITTLTMGVGSVAIGLLPTYAQVGVAAPLSLFFLRVVQGLALGGEYGGGVIYVAENSSDRRRGLWTSLLQSASSLGLLLATAVVLGVLTLLGPAGFLQWGWRIPFLAASPLLGISLYARWRLRETLLFERLTAQKRTSPAPLSEALRDRQNARRIGMVILVVGGASVVWHTAQFYSQIFLQGVMKGLTYHGLLPTLEAMLVALLLAAPFYPIFGALSDRWGRLRVVLVGTVVGGLAAYPTFFLLARFAAPPAPNVAALVLLLWPLLVLGAMCYAPLGAYLVELFPGRLRYTSVSIAHGIGTGDIGDATVIGAPVIALLLAAPLAGTLWCTLVPLACAPIAYLLLRRAPTPGIWREVETPPAHPDPAR